MIAPNYYIVEEVASIPAVTNLSVISEDYSAPPQFGAESELRWLEDLYSAVARKEQEEAGDLLFTKVFDAFEQPATIDSILRTVDFERLDTLLVIGVLSATNPVKKQLKERPRAFMRARERLLTLAPDRVEALLAGLE